MCTQIISQISLGFLNLHAKKGCFSMHYGSKGWYVEKLKEAGVRTYEERKVERYKKHVLAKLLAKIK